MPERCAASPESSSVSFAERCARRIGRRLQASIARSAAASCRSRLPSPEPCDSSTAWARRRRSRTLPLRLGRPASPSPSGVRSTLLRARFLARRCSVTRLRSGTQVPGRRARRSSRCSARSSRRPAGASGCALVIDPKGEIGPVLERDAAKRAAAHCPVGVGRGSHDGSGLAPRRRPCPGPLSHRGAPHRAAGALVRAESPRPACSPITSTRPGPPTRSSSTAKGRRCSSSCLPSY